MTDTRVYSLDDLLYLMARLRKPDTGCPWDLEQSYQSITPSTIEEAYEVVDAIERGDMQHLREELGDLVFQAVFYAQLAEEDGHFDFRDIIDGLTAKLIRRHPHVFSDGVLESERCTESDQVLPSVGAQWEAIKAEERKQKGAGGLLDDVPVTLPSLQRAQKLQKRVAKQGMDFSSSEAALAKIEEELEELREAQREGSTAQQEEELGDLLFSCVNFARKRGLDADACLRRANTKFERRIRAMDTAISASGQSWSALSEADYDALWNQAKARE